MRRQLAGKRIIVTGASSGIGRAVASRLAAGGARVAIVARTLAKLQEIDDGSMHVITADVSSPEDRQRIIQDTVKAFDGLDILVNIAGIGAWGHFHSSTEAINRQIFETNFFAPLELTRLAVPHLTSGDQPLIVNLTSMTGRRGMPAWPEYSASKFALVGMTEALRGEMERFGIDTLTVVPGLTKTGLSQNLLRSEGRVKIPYETGMEPQYVGERIVNAMERGKTEIVLGGEAKKILFLNRWTPRWLNRLIAKRVTKEYSNC